MVGLPLLPFSCFSQLSNSLRLLTQRTPLFLLSLQSSAVTGRRSEDKEHTSLSETRDSCCREYSYLKLITIASHPEDQLAVNNWLSLSLLLLNFLSSYFSLPVQTESYESTTTTTSRTTASAVLSPNNNQKSAAFYFYFYWLGRTHTIIVTIISPLSSEAGKRQSQSHCEDIISDGSHHQQQQLRIAELLLLLSSSVVSVVARPL